MVNKWGALWGCILMKNQQTRGGIALLNGRCRMPRQRSAHSRTSLRRQIEDRIRPLGPRRARAEVSTQEFGRTVGTFRAARLLEEFQRLLTAARLMQHERRFIVARLGRPI